MHYKKTLSIISFLNGETTVTALFCYILPSGVDPKGSMPPSIISKLFRHANSVIPLTVLHSCII